MQYVRPKRWYTSYTASIPDASTLHSHRRHNLKYNIWHVRLQNWVSLTWELFDAEISNIDAELIYSTEISVTDE